MNTKLCSKLAWLRWIGDMFYLGEDKTSLLTSIGLWDVKYFSVAGWQSLTGKQKQIVCISLFYAANWMRELVSCK